MLVVSAVCVSVCVSVCRSAANSSSIQAMLEELEMRCAWWRLQEGERSESMDSSRLITACACPVLHAHCWHTACTVHVWRMCLPSHTLCTFSACTRSACVRPVTPPLHVHSICSAFVVHVHHWHTASACAVHVYCMCTAFAPSARARRGSPRPLCPFGAPFTRTPRHAVMCPEHHQLLSDILIR